MSARIRRVATMSLTMLLLWISSSSAAPPGRANLHIPTLNAAISRHWPAMPMPEVAGGQVEQESGWKERATLSTPRELGRGMSQLTIAYRADGSERFNAYRDALAAYPSLRDWDWQSDPYNPRYQLSYLIMRDRGSYRQCELLKIRGPDEIWRAALVSYNAGYGRVLKRRAEALRRGLPADRWRGGLELAHGKGERALLYGRPLWQAVNEYPEMILRRAGKYRGHVGPGK